MNCHLFVDGAGFVCPVVSLTLAEALSMHSERLRSGALALAQTVLCFFQPSARPVCFPTEGIWGGAPWLDTRTRNPIPLQKIARVLTGVMKVNEEA
jgi:hypothetical protein